MKRKLILAIIILVFVAGALLAHDVHQERQDTIVLNGGVLVYADWAQPGN